MIHTHKYHLVKLGKKKDYLIYACALPNCSHNIPKALGINRKSICWKCGDEFILYKNKYDRIKPICLSCANPAIIENPSLDDLMEKLGID